MRHVKISKDLNLIEQSFKTKADKTKTESKVNHIWIYDRSGSMCGLLNDLTDDLITRCKDIPTGDSVTLGWFSGKGQYNIFVKGFKITEKADYKTLEKMIKNNSTTVGMTCFSEVLAELKTVVSDLKPITNNFSLCFFTDGYPVVPNYDAEIKDIHKAISNVKDSVTSSLFVGYGNYYNKELMSDMAERCGGALCHSGELQEFGVSLNDFIKGAKRRGRLAIDVEVDNPSLGFTLDKSEVNCYAVDNQRISIPVPDEDEAKIYYVAKSVPTGSKSVPIGEMLDGAYAAALLMVQRTKSDVALEVLGTVGDVYLMDSVNNAFTNAEYGKVEKAIKDAIFTPNKRYLGGKNTKYMPAEDAFCVLDLLNILMNDEEAHMYPYHKDFNYERIGRKAVAIEGEKKFTPVKNPKCPLAALTWHSTKLNLSLRTKIDGSINLGKNPHGFASSYPTYVWRNYTLVKDGFTNVAHLPVSTSEDTYQVFKKLGIASDKDTSGIYVLDLSSVPVINRVICSGRTSGKTLCKQVFQERLLEAEIKVYKYFKDILEQKEEKKTEFISEEAKKFLEDAGINKDGSFSFASEKLPATDYYMAKEFDVKIKGFSTLKKVADVIKKIEDGKDVTGCDGLMVNAIKAGKMIKKVDALEVIIKDRRAKLNAVRSEIQKTKFSVLLAKKWFDEFTSREYNKLVVDGNEFTFELSESKVEI